MGAKTQRRDAAFGAHAIAVRLGRSEQAMEGMRGRGGAGGHGPPE